MFFCLSIRIKMLADSEFNREWDVLLSTLEIDCRLRLKKSMPETNHRSDTSRIIPCDVDIPIVFELVACTGRLLEFFGYLKVRLVIQALCHEALAICEWHIILRPFLALMRCCKVSVNGK
jgi:hypothetical protein